MTRLPNYAIVKVRERSTRARSLESHFYEVREAKNIDVSGIGFSNRGVPPLAARHARHHSSASIDDEIAMDPEVRYISHLAHTTNDSREVLGVTPDACRLRSGAFRKLAMQYHPDRNPGDADAAERMKEINRAYEAIIRAARGTPHISS